jgi:hypothetical protein
MVVIPAEADQIVAIGLSAVGPGKDMMDFEPVSRRAAFHGATPIPMEDMTPKLPVHGPGTTSQIERSPGLVDPDQVDPRMTEDPFEGAGSDPGSRKDSDPLLRLGFDCGVGVDNHHHINRS